MLYWIGLAPVLRNVRFDVETGKTLFAYIKYYAADW